MNIVEIACPRCGSPIGNFNDGKIRLFEKCTNCLFDIKKLKEVPILRECEDINLNMLDAVDNLEPYNSFDLGIPFVNKALASSLPTLQIGGGIDLCSATNLLKTDAFLYSEKMHLIADAHSLPFPDETFSYVYSLAVFEHLHSPWIAADEIFRVLKPEGEVYVLTAFMQHEHGYPDHYFNMTASGLKRIFSNFEIHEVKPSIHSNFDQLSYILLDFMKMVDEADLGEDSALSKNILNHSVKEFCNSVKKLDQKLLASDLSTINFQKISPSMELVARKR